ncbi:unnamed protein product [Cylindrotheca closterium]|uniref:Uncharacterized protein n=1 Tax=Cylindrotheca closterium TaxID=2856 RepID=A0AAD2PY50_9STRA|nr:unnamed protein product [Cylindrotheca closterium]
MTKVGSNVEKFNLHVSKQLDNLAHYGGESKDILIHLFEGYKAASDKPFVSYIERKEEKHEDNSETTNEPKLMQDAKNYYKNCVRDQTWNCPDENQQAILLLKAEFKQIKNSKKSESGKKKDNDKKSGGGKNKGRGKNNNKQKSLIVLLQKQKINLKQSMLTMTPSPGICVKPSRNTAATLRINAIKIKTKTRKRTRSSSEPPWPSITPRPAPIQMKNESSSRAFKGGLLFGRGFGGVCCLSGSLIGGNAFRSASLPQL